jgi:hypothetical protein
VEMTIYRQSLFLLPALYGSHVPFEIAGDLLPGIEAIVRGGFTWRCYGGRARIAFH